MELFLLLLLVAGLVLFFSGWQILKAILSITFTVVSLYLFFKLLLILSVMPFVFLIMIGTVIGILISSSFRNLSRRRYLLRCEAQR